MKKDDRVLVQYIVTIEFIDIRQFEVNFPYEKKPRTQASCCNAKHNHKAFKSYGVKAEQKQQNCIQNLALMCSKHTRQVKRKEFKAFFMKHLMKYFFLFFICDFNYVPAEIRLDRLG